MTIKEIEKVLGIPRATVRFYEKEGLLAPCRTENGYRNYSDEDVKKLKKIIILRKIGMPVEVINDIFDGAKSMDKALDDNILSLYKELEQLKGAIKISEKMKEDNVDIVSLDSNDYWDIIEEEEKQGNSFMDIAKDIVALEKGVIYSYFSFTDEDGKPYDSVTKCIPKLFLIFLLAGCIKCMIGKEWTFDNFLGGMQGILYIILIEVVLSVPLYFLGKKFPWVKKHRNLVLTIVCIVLIVILLILASMFGI